MCEIPVSNIQGMSRIPWNSLVFQCIGRLGIENLRVQLDTRRALRIHRPGYRPCMVLIMSLTRRFWDSSQRERYRLGDEVARRAPGFAERIAARAVFKSLRVFEARQD